MTKLKTFAAFLALCAPLTAGCAVDTEAPVAESDEAAVVTATDAQMKKEIQDAIAGLETELGGGEADPEPYQLVDAKPRRGEKFDDAFVLKRLMPKMQGLDHDRKDSNMVPGLDAGDDMNAEWDRLTAEPDADDYQGDAEGLAAAKAGAAKWRAVKAVMTKHLTNIRSMNVGYRLRPGGSLETGAVALMIAGQTASGYVIAIYGIVIWT